MDAFPTALVRTWTGSCSAGREGREWVYLLTVGPAVVAGSGGGGMHLGLLRLSGSF